MCESKNTDGAKILLQLNETAGSSGNLSSCVLEISKYLRRHFAIHLERIEVIDFLILYLPGKPETKQKARCRFTKKKGKFYATCSIFSSELGLIQRTTKDYKLERVIEIVTSLHENALTTAIVRFYNDEEEKEVLLQKLESEIALFKKKFDPVSSAWFNEKPSLRRERLQKL